MVCSANGRRGPYVSLPHTLKLVLVSAELARVSGELAAWTRGPVFIRPARRRRRQGAVTCHPS